MIQTVNSIKDTFIICAETHAFQVQKRNNYCVLCSQWSREVWNVEMQKNENA